MANAVLKTSGQYVFFLSCLHTVRYSIGEPTSGDKVFCTRCYDYRMVLHREGLYGVNCRHCRYAKNYGGKLSAMTWAEKHSRKYRMHVIDVYGEDFHVEVTTQPTLEYVDCPF
jgi:hypothetical protein